MSNAIRRWTLAILAGLRHAADPLRSAVGGGRHSLARRLTIAAVPVILAVPLLTAVALPGSSKASDAGQGGAVPTVNWALSGQATANSTETGSPASNAIDGDAGTDWCTSAWTGSLVVDLGQVRSLSDLGITLDATSPSASATIQVASQAGDWQAVPAAKNASTTAASAAMPTFFTSNVPLYHRCCVTGAVLPVLCYQHCVPDAGSLARRSAAGLTP